MNQVIKEDKGSVEVAAGQSNTASFPDKCTDLDLKMPFLKPELACSTDFYSSSFFHSFPVNLKEPFRNAETIIVSPHFFFRGFFWAIKLRIKEDPNSNIEVFLVSYIGRDPVTLEEKTIEISATFFLYVLANVSDDNIISHSYGPELTTLNSTSKHGNVMGILSISKGKLLSHPFLYIPDNVLTIGCELNWDFHSQNMETLPYPENPFPLKPNSFEKFFNNSKFNDLKISTGGQIFHASKLLLCEASNVFEQLIFSESSETNTIHIEDINADAFKGILRYISCKVLPDLQLEEHAEDWFKITEKFKLHALQNVLQKGFLLQLKPSNAIMCLKAADKYSVGDLRNNCIKYIQGNWKEVVANHGLKKFTICSSTADVECYEELQKSVKLLGEITEGLQSKRPRLT